MAVSAKSMNLQERADFIDAYMRVLITAWSSEEFASRLEAGAQVALRECGIEVPASASVELVRSVPEGTHEGSLDAQVEAWDEGARTGRYLLFVPDKPQMSTAELTEGDLDMLPAGIIPYYSCSSCPCCCTSG